MDQEDLKTAKKIDLVESASQTSDHTIVDAERRDKAEGPARDSGTSKVDQPTSDTLSTDLENPDRIIGKVIGGHYEIVSQIGHGGMSTVYKARHQHLQKDVAIKFLSFGRQFDGKAIARFREEAKSASSLVHSNICATREYGVEGGVPFLVMDYVEGTSLGDLLAQEETLSEARTIEIALGVCAGLEHAHASGVIHRDIKPANILISKDRAGDEAVKIVDFGIAKLMREDESGPNLTQTGEVFGTPKYMSPEQCLGNKVDQRADIYALGCILFEMLSGRAPFYDDSAIKILFSHVNDAPPSLVNCSKDMQTIVERCLQKDAALRYQNVSELAADLNAVKSGASLLHARPRQAVKRVPVLPGLLAVILAICVFAFFTITHQLRTETEITKAWTSAHNQAVSFKQSNQPVAEEKQLEKCLEIAKKSKSESLLAMTLQELADVETVLGKTDEAREHTQTLTNRIKGGGLSEYFLMVAFLMIIVGVALATMAVALFGPGGRGAPPAGWSLKELFEQLDKRQF